MNIAAIVLILGMNVLVIFAALVQGYKWGYQACKRDIKIWDE